MTFRKSRQLHLLVIILCYALLFRSRRSDINRTASTLTSPTLRSVGIPLICPRFFLIFFLFPSPQDNIIAMGFPSGDVSDFADDSRSAMAKSKLSKVEALYRNPISEVVRFLDTKHPGTYKVYNLCSERLYDPENFHMMVAHFAFEDHNCPPLMMVQSFCCSAADHLSKSAKHVVAVHCKAGKSRTGLMICALMLHLKLFSSPAECIQFYNAARCHDLKGLTLASQRRYVRYYFHEMRHGPAPENPRFLCSICVTNSPPNLSLFWRFRTHLPRDPYTSTRDLERNDECICNVRQPCFVAL